MRPEEIVRLREALAGPLPGHDAFLEVSGYKRPDIEAVLRQRPAPRESAVLVLFYPRRDELHTLFGERTLAQAGDTPRACSTVAHRDVNEHRHEWRRSVAIDRL